MPEIFRIFTVILYKATDPYFLLTYNAQALLNHLTYTRLSIHIMDINQYKHLWSIFCFIIFATEQNSFMKQWKIHDRIVRFTVVLWKRLNNKLHSNKTLLNKSVSIYISHETSLNPYTPWRISSLGLNPDESYHLPVHICQSVAVYLTQCRQAYQSPVFRYQQNGSLIKAVC